MKQFAIIFIILIPTLISGQPRLKEITEYYPKTKTIKKHYFVIKPKNVVCHSTYEIYRPNGQIEERGYFEYGVKTSYIKFDTKGQVLKELRDSILTTNEYFANGELKSTQKTKNGELFGIWENYDLNECGKTYLISSTEYQENQVISSTESVNNMFLGIFSVNTLVTEDATGNIDTTYVSNSCDLIYPSEARRNQIEGTLFIKINLTADCDLTYEFINELGYGIEDQFIDKLELARKNLQANHDCQDIEVTIPIQFKLQ
ncbi:hypothetical protein [Fulvivirga ligni]|uniref:hypothetical protein n=1 Tax=Fulvivirga ligni TaxID=2904246 RepID=UPI001F4440E7|nr:hypothetical protein [Fulvivirga ligni]UII20551.1 hypothetical protein LVD16_22175 [Fulvivirga ligni]